MKKLKALATGIGSVPHKDAQKALKFIFQRCPQIPYWPQMPKRDSREGMVTQFSEGLPCLELKPSGLTFEPQDKDRELEIFYEKVINRKIPDFKISRDFAEGLYAFEELLGSRDLSAVSCLKCHVTGPFTFAASVKDHTGTPLLYDPVFRQVITNGLVMKALWQAQFLERFKKNIMVFVDEPYLGCFGSAYTPINRDEVVQALTEFTQPLAQAGIITGVHCCGNTDWSIFTDVATLDIINFDAFEYQDKFLLYAQELKAFLQRGGVICWGVVPTQEGSEALKARTLVKKVEDGIASLVKKGLPEALLLDNMLLSPACGMGSLEEARAEQILEVLSEVSDHFRK